MGLIDRFRRHRVGAHQDRGASARIEPQLSASAGVQSESQWNGFSVGGGVSRAGVRVTERSVLSIPATLQALRILTGVFAMTPMPYFRRSDAGRDRVRGGVAELLSTAPNAHQTGFAFRELMQADLLLSGAFFAYVSRDFAGRPVALTRLKPGAVLIAEHWTRSEGRHLFFDATLPDGSHERFAARDIWHIAGMSRDGLTGLNPVAYARDAFGGAIATADHAARFWGNGARPSTVITAKQKIAPEDRARIKGDWKAVYGGPDGDDIAVVDQDLDVKFLSHDNLSSQYLETRGFQVVELARIWGVPPHLLFDLSRATFSNIEHQGLEFITYHLGPTFARVQQAATQAFAEVDHYFEHMTDALVRGDLKSRMEAYWQERQMGIASANELRARDNLPPIPGDAGSEFWRPGNMMVAGQPAPDPGPRITVNP